MNRRERITDEILILRCQAGDVTAFSELVDRWQARLWRHASRLLEEKEAAWDVVQETWIGISRDLPRLKDAAAFPSWAYRITSNKCRDWLRREVRRHRADELYFERHLNNEAGAFHAEHRTASLKEALENLPGGDQAILGLRYREGFSTGEIADILSIPVGTVKSRLHNARRRLRTMLEEPHDERSGQEP